MRRPAWPMRVCGRGAGLITRRGLHPPLHPWRRADGCTLASSTPPTAAPGNGEDEHPPTFRPYPAFRLLAQCLAVSLPLGAGGVDLVGRTLFHLPATALSPDQAAFAAAGTEGLTLVAVAGLCSAAGKRSEGGVRPPFYGATLESALVGVGSALGGAALATVASLAWGAAVGTAQPALDSPTTDAVGALLATTTTPGAAALVTASALLAPAIEELIYRHILLGALLDGGVVGEAGAVCLSAAAFSLSHAGVAPADMPALFGLGTALGVAGVVGGRLAGPGRSVPVDVGAATLAHALYNGGVLAAVVASAAGWVGRQG